MTAAPLGKRPPPKAREDAKEDAPTLHARLACQAIRGLINTNSRLVRLENGETRWVVFTSDAITRSNEEVRPFVKAGRLDDSVFRDPVSDLGEKHI